MPRRKFVDKKNATTFALVHRAGDDPRIHDADAPSMVFAEKQTAQPKTLRRARDEDYAYSDTASVISGASTNYRSSKVRQRGDLEEEFGLNVRPNEGEAAQHGVFYDDTEYDYMQHMKDLGAGGGNAMWVEASAPPQAKRKQNLEDALREVNLDDVRSFGTAETSMSKARSLLPEDVLPSEFVQRRTYQDQQDVPDAIAGFQPDMDPRLREVLEALEDEEYVDDEDEEDIFGKLVEEGEVDEDEFEMMGEQMLLDDDEAPPLFDSSEAQPGAVDEDDGWESDDTVKASSPPLATTAPSLAELKEQGEMIHPPSDAHAQLPADPTAGSWLDEYKKFKSTGKTLAPVSAKEAPLPLSTSAAPANGTNRKSTKGSTNFSMTSSTLSRTAHQRLLDARFDRLESNYAADRFPDDPNDRLSEIGSLASDMSRATGQSNVSRMSTMSGMSRMSTLSQARASGPKSVRQDFDGILDDFMASTGSAKGAKRRGVRRGKLGDGLSELDEVRQELGPARVKGRTAAASGS